MPGDRVKSECFVIHLHQTYRNYVPLSLCASSHLYQKKFLTLLLKVLLLKVFILATTTFTGNNETL